MSDPAFQENPHTSSRLHMAVKAFVVASVLVIGFMATGVMDHDIYDIYEPGSNIMDVAHLGTTTFSTVNP